jgi:hypothetical protein
MTTQNSLSRVRSRGRLLVGRRQYAGLLTKQDIFGDQRVAVTQGRTDEANEE